MEPSQDEPLVLRGKILTFKNKKLDYEYWEKGVLLIEKGFISQVGNHTDINYPQKYNQLINVQNKFKCEKLKRHDHKYDLFIPIKYNFKNPVVGLGSAIFIHLTKDYKPTAGCVALIKKDFLIMLKIIKKNSKIKIL